jgi:hypothetical protein
MLQPVKGAVIAFLWWHGIGAFRQERRAAPPALGAPADEP